MNGSRLRIGLSVPLFKNAFVYARDLNAADTDKAYQAKGLLDLIGWFDGKRVGVATVVFTVTDYPSGQGNLL